MAGHGGVRQGAGRPEGGISQARRLILQGLQRGFEKAGRKKGLTGEAEEVVVESIAHVAADLILAGQGRDALAILVQAAPKGDDGEGGDGKKSPLVRALERLPGLAGGPQSARTDETDPANTAKPELIPVGPQHPQSGAPFFTPQVPLLPPGLDPSLPSSVPGVGTRPEFARAARVGGGDPLPPPAAPVPSTHPRAEEFEKKSPHAAGAE